MHDHIAIVKDEPTLLRLTFDASFFLIVNLRSFQHAFGKRVQHAVAGAVANDEIICKGCNVFYIEEQDVFALLVLQGADDFMGKF